VESPAGSFIPLRDFLGSQYVPFLIQPELINRKSPT